jgi:hypothetical protein
MKFTRKILLLSLLFDVAVIGVVAFLILRNTNAGTSLRTVVVDSGQNASPWWLIFIPVTLIIIGISILPFVRSVFPGTLKNGVRAEATVLSVWDTGVSINNNPQVGMLLDVRPSMAPAFQAQAKKLVSRINTGAIQPGMKVQVIYDPANPKRIEVQSIQGFDETQAAPGVSTTEMRLKELNSLREKDLISRDEYDKKREEILKNL